MPTLPTFFDVRRGIKTWLDLGNWVYGDCVIAAWLHLTMVHNVAKASTWKKLLYRIGYRPPHDPFAVEEYTAFLATLHEKPSGTQGVDPFTFFTWLKGNNKIEDFQSIPATLDAIHAAMIEWDGCMLILNLTNRAYNIGLSHRPWILEPGDVPNPMLGHAVALVEYGPEMNGIVTWGEMKDMSNDFSNECVYACWVFK